MNTTTRTLDDLLGDQPVLTAADIARKIAGLAWSEAADAKILVVSDQYDLNQAEAALDEVSNNNKHDN